MKYAVPMIKITFSDVKTKNVYQIFNVLVIFAPIINALETILHVLHKFLVSIAMDKIALETISLATMIGANKEHTENIVVTLLVPQINTVVLETLVIIIKTVKSMIIFS